MATEPARSLSPAPASELVRWPPWPEIAYPLWPDDLSRWFLPEDDDSMPWTTLLTALQRHLFSCLRKLLEEQHRDWFVGYEQKMRLDPHDQRIGVLPDLYVLPCQPEDPNFAEWPAYVPGIPVPVFALEVVSPSNWEKDYVGAPQKYAKLGVEELLVFDELAREGKSPASDPYVLQLYRKDRRGRLKRVYAGEGPVYSEALGGWFRTEGQALTISRDQAGTSRVLTYEETEGWWKKLEEERKGKEQAQKQAEGERAAKEDAEKKAQNEAQARLSAEQAKMDAERKLQSEAQARIAAEQARLSAEQAKMDAERKAQHEAQARIAAEQARKATEQAKIDAETKARHEAQARIAAEQAKKDTESKLRSEAQARKAAEQAKKDAETKAQNEEQARKAAEQAKMDAESKAQHEAQARLTAEQARLAAEQAQKDAEQQALLEARLAVADLCDLLGLEWTEARRQQIDSLDLAALRQLRASLKLLKRWPG